MDIGYLTKRLILPLLGAAALSLWLSGHAQEPWKSLLLSFAAAFVGSIVTVFYIDVILQRHERAQWASVRATATQQLMRLGNICISSVRTAFRLGPELLDREVMYSGDLTRMHAEIIRLAEHVLIPMSSAVSSMNQQAWRTFITNMQGASQLADRLLVLFGSQFDPATIQSVLDVQSAVERIITQYSTYPDIFGVPIEKLPTKTDGSSSVPAQRVLNQMMADDVAGLLKLCAKFLRQLDPRLQSDQGR